MSEKLSEEECVKIIEKMTWKFIRDNINVVYGFKKPTIFGYDISEGVGKRLWEKLSIKYYQTY